MHNIRDNIKIKILLHLNQPLREEAAGVDRDFFADAYNNLYHQVQIPVYDGVLLIVRNDIQTIFQ